jgi:hypothetical protein
MGIADCGREIGEDVGRKEFLESGERPVQDDGPVAGAGRDRGFGIEDERGETGLGEQGG